MGNREVLDLRDIAADERAFEGKTVTVQGWVRNHRRQKSIGFMEFFDGTVLSPMQIVYDESVQDFAGVQAIRNGAAISATGKLVAGRGGALEMQAQEIGLEGDCTEDYPLQPKRHTLEFLRDIAYLRPRTRLFQAVFRVRSIAAQAIHNYFQSRGYVYVHTPLITANDAEGAGNTFTVTTTPPGKPYKAEEDFFGRNTALAVTGQLEAETYALAYKRVYTFGPTFRAENSNTKTHAAEFWMIEPEVCFCDLKGLMDLEEDFLKSVVREVLDKAMPELTFLQGYAKSNLISKLQALTTSTVARVTHAQAIDILQKAPRAFEHPAVQGEDLFKEHEKYLTEEYFGSPVFIYDWPKDIKAFYMYQNDDGETVAAVDLLVPGSGELMGGSQRETRADRLSARMAQLGIHEKQMEWYVNLRRYGGCTHSGFGMGFERLVMYLTDMENIRDVIPYPRTPGNCDF
ncbi:MAG TPA: asparagine--tRNA ligase [Candidatus Ventricola intestinavium]|nr:asparagine--tRNA ligase [Candidatus Ventricola intestinavium]